MFNMVARFGPTNTLGTVWLWAWAMRTPTFRRSCEVIDFLFANRYTEPFDQKLLLSLAKCDDPQISEFANARIQFNRDLQAEHKDKGQS